MLEFLRPITTLDNWLYIGLGLVALFFVRLMWQARRDQYRSIFTLERESAQARMSRAFFGLMVVLGMLVGVYYLSLITPTLVPASQVTPTPTQIIGLPPTPTSPPLLPTFTVTPTPEPPPTFIAGNDVIIPPTATATPSAPVAPANSSGQRPACANANSVITQPGNGARVDGIVQVAGRAMLDDFSYYKLEYRLPGGEWAWIESYFNPVPSGALGLWNSDTVPPGNYEFRVVVVDSIGNYPEPCTIRLIVE